MQGDIARVVDSTMFVSNVAQSTPQASAPPANNIASLSPKKDQLLRILRSSPATPVRVDRLDFLLTGYPDDLKHFLISGFSFGFRISYVGERQTFESRNLKSALEKPHVVLSKLNKEREAGRIAGPFTVPPFPIFHCSPLGIVPKKDPSEFG